MISIRGGVLVLLGLIIVPLFLIISPAWGLTVGDLAPDVKVFNPDQEEDVTLYSYLGDRLGLVWVWTDKFT